jgi:hypothetical protein
MTRVRQLVLSLAAVVVLAGTVRAHGAALRGSAGTLDIPTWLFLGTGGLVVGASFLLATFATDRAFVRRSHATKPIGSPPAVVATWLPSVLGLVGLAAVLVFGFGATTTIVPTAPLENLAVLLVWAGWWAGYVLTLYLLGNTWPAFDPFRTIATVIPTRDREYPERFGAWPAVVGLLAIVFVEVTLPLAEDPVALATVVSAYGVVTIAGAVTFGVDDWFSTADPVARAFDHYGRVAPIGRGSSGLELRLPGAGLVDAVDDEASGPSFGDRGAVAFVVALVFATTYDGVVATPGWRWLLNLLQGVLPDPGLELHALAVLVYAIAFVLGYVTFLVAYWSAAALGRVTGDTYVTVDEIARRFAPSVLAIAAGYHLAHYLGFFLSLSLPLASTALAPTNPPAPTLLVLPDAFGAVGVTAVLLGHLLAIWSAHAIGFDVFPERLQAIRVQYALVGVMVAYTILSLWIVSQPTVTPPFL